MQAAILNLKIFITIGINGWSIPLAGITKAQ
jgi:hypothetical protein